MSISIGAYGAAGADLLLLRMLSQLGNTNGVSPGASSGSSDTTGGAQVSATTSSTAAPLTGNAQGGLSDDILALLVHLQAQAGSDAPANSSAGNTSTSVQTAGSDNPVQQLFSAMDADGDGTVSQTELEKYIESKGGTQQQADALFSVLSQGGSGQNGSAGISEQQLANDVSQSQGLEHRHHHHHHHGDSNFGSGSASGSSAAAQLFTALDTNQDGSVSADEFAAAFGSDGVADASNSNSSDPSQLFSQIDTNGDKSISGAELNTFLASLTQQIQSDLSNLGTLSRFATQSYEAAQAANNAAQPSAFA